MIIDALIYMMRMLHVLDSIWKHEMSDVSVCLTVIFMNLVQKEKENMRHLQAWKSFLILSVCFLNLGSIFF